MERNNSTVINIAIKALKVHPQNENYFDDIAGEDYETFKKSIDKDGIVTPLIITNDMVIISGHQRFKAALDLGFDTVPVIIRDDLPTEEDRLRVLLAANIGRTKNDENKQRQAIAEYIKLCGFSHGGNRRSSNYQNGKLNYDELSRITGLSKRKLQRMVAIETKLSEPMKQFLDDGVFSATIASDIIASLSEEEQCQVLDIITETRSCDPDKKYSKQEMEDIINELKQSKKRIKELEEQKILIAEKEVDKPETLMELEAYRKDYDSLNNMYTKLRDENFQLKEKIRMDKNNTPEEQFNKKLKDDTIFFCSRAADFIKTMGGYVWIADHIDELPDRERRSYIHAIKEIGAWSDQMENNINNGHNYLQN